mmetsp:Transcript_26359/g.65989  ORF Transcript_26359/g.65989 Transcript_26359/m.65989 type:complete len:281 (+) Transcript_26359:99-941(+)
MRFSSRLSSNASPITSASHPSLAVAAFKFVSSTTFPANAIVFSSLLTWCGLPCGTTITSPGPTDASITVTAPAAGNLSSSLPSRAPRAAPLCGTRSAISTPNTGSPPVSATAGYSAAASARCTTRQRLRPASTAIQKCVRPKSTWVPEPRAARGETKREGHAAAKPSRGGVSRRRLRGKSAWRKSGGSSSKSGRRPACICRLWSKTWRSPPEPAPRSALRNTPSVSCPASTIPAHVWLDESHVCRSITAPATPGRRSTPEKSQSGTPGTPVTTTGSPGPR